MFAIIALAAVLQKKQIPVVQQSLASPFGGPDRVLYLSYGGAIEQPKTCPFKFGNPPSTHVFDFLTAGYGIVRPGDTKFDLRFRVYSQSLQNNLSFGIPVARQLLRLWEMNLNWLRIDHSELFHDHIVDVYLASSGTPGGQQLFGIDEENGIRFKSNMMFIYDLPSFNDPLEECREVAHEYGHAVLPAIGGYSKPEYWANGYLGEKIFLRWLDQELTEGKISTDDTMGASKEELDAWIAKNIDPIEQAAASLGPKNTKISGTSAASMSAFHGLVCYCESIMPRNMFGRSLVLIGSQKAVDYVNGAVLASEESSWKPTFPANLLNMAVWLPVGPSGKVSGAKILSKSKGWVKVMANSKIEIIQPTATD